MKQEKEILYICINHENCPLDPVSCGCSIETTTFEDACLGKRTFIPGIECDKWGIYMKHQKEWCTCDRCGAEINENEKSMFLKKVYRISGLLVRKYAYEKVNAFDLCPKCRKDFERFMKNE